ncbi:hypothetical protein [Cesiribacter sp. SM1]|uniref:hypothetical protein n=1 Tax=Cesiribacter sp. SM1 TaxID=2861196 RepID=UPI001CD70FA3|nr:hypothetical protein [Cesiribacter sp. SM1]
MRVLILPMVLILQLILPLSACAQRKVLQRWQHKNTLFVELGGLGPYYSLNLDHLINRRKIYGKFNKRKKVMYSYRLGFSVLPTLVSVPLGLSLITAPNSRHHAEFSVGVAPLVKNPFNIFGERQNMDKIVLAGVGAGYRYQVPRQGLFLSVGIKPVLQFNPSAGGGLKIEKGLFYSGYLGLGFTL